jgi:hypothetical protein
LPLATCAKAEHGEALRREIVEETLAANPRYYE